MKKSRVILSSMAFSFAIASALAASTVAPPEFYVANEANPVNVTN